VLKEEPEGVDKVISSLDYLRKKHRSRRSSSILLI